MKRKEQELLERGEGNGSWQEEPADQRADGQEDEFDQEFWIKVSNFLDCVRLKKGLQSTRITRAAFGYTLVHSSLPCTSIFLCLHSLI